MDQQDKQQNILIPNSTQIPNVISDLIMPRISEAEMRCLNYICRRTYGFQKERDRISLSQFINGIKGRDERRLDYGTGVSRPSVVEALRNLLGSDLIRTIRTPKGNYYEINLELFRNKDNKEIEKTADEVVKKVNQLRKLTRTGKESKPRQVKLPNLQNKVLNKEKPSYIAISNEIADNINPLIELFKPINPSYERLYANKTQRAAMKRLIEKFDKQKLEKILNTLSITNGMKFAPIITTPLELENKVGKLIAFIKQQRSDQKIKEFLR